MPVTIKSVQMKYKDQYDNYVGVDAVSDFTTEQKLEAINTAGTTQTGTVNSAGETQLAAVNGAGSTQITNINNRAAEIENSWPSDYTELTEDVEDLKSAINVLDMEETLLRSDLPGTTVTVTFDNNDNPVSIVHSANGTAVRTDTFVWGTDTVTETRTASDKYITITTNLETLSQTVSEIQEVA